MFLKRCDGLKKKKLKLFCPTWEVFLGHTELNIKYMYVSCLVKVISIKIINTPSHRRTASYQCFVTVKEKLDTKAGASVTCDSAGLQRDEKIHFLSF